MLPLTRKLSRKIASLAMIAPLGLVGCGGGSGSSSTTESTATSAATPSMHRSTGKVLSTTISVKSPALRGKGVLPAAYTCDGKNESLPVSWTNLPAHTAEVLLFVINGQVAKGDLFLRQVEWGVAGLKPSLGSIPSGKLPPGAIQGKNGSGHAKYSICPDKGPAQGYAVLLYALPHRIAVKPGFDVAKLRERAADLALAGGLLIMNYQRRAGA